MQLHAALPIAACDRLGHGSQASEPMEALYLSAGHGVQSTPSPVYPASHSRGFTGVEVGVAIRGDELCDTGVEVV